MNLYPAAAEPIGTPSIHRGVVWDLYASVISLQNDGGSATFRFYRNPGVNWLWAGGLVMALGGIAAAWPPRRRRDGPGRDRGARVPPPRAVGGARRGIPARSGSGSPAPGWPGREKAADRGAMGGAGNAARREAGAREPARDLGTGPTAGAG
jgi:hypothetical protein